MAGKMNEVQRSAYIQTLGGKLPEDFLKRSRNREVMIYSNFWAPHRFVIYKWLNR